MTNLEEWRPIPGYEGHYEVSDRGAVRSLRRKIIMRNGRPRTVGGRLISPSTDDQGRLNLQLHRGGVSTNYRVHTLVALAFIGPRPAGADIRHLNGDPGDNRPQNLAYGTHSENMRDMVSHGRNNVAKRECPRGHPYSGDNLRIIPSTGGRACRSCQAAHALIQRGGARREDLRAVADDYYRRKYSNR